MTFALVTSASGTALPFPQCAMLLLQTQPIYQHRILYLECMLPVGLWRDRYERQKYRTSYVQVKDSESEVLASLDISETPALVVLTSDDETVKYDGEIVFPKCQGCLDTDAQAATISTAHRSS